MAAPSLDVDWTAIRTAAENGVHFEKIAARFGVKSETIRKKAQRHSWVLQKDLVKGQSLPLSQAGTMNVPQPKKPPVIVPKEEIVALIQESIAEKGAAYERMVADKFAPVVQNATLGVIKTASDLEKVDKVVRKALHLESGDNQINVAIVPGAWAAMNVKTIDSRNSGEPTFGVDSTESPSLTLDVESDSEVG